ncbi:MAG TPA: hypothetical protein VL127_12925, partial [Bryobacteraceae bacterium]|nr:hypothetical protein [Bryobacteraceae bacterium]
FLMRWFERLGIATEFAVAHQTPSRFLEGKNLVLVGNRRTYPLLYRLMVGMGFNFQIHDDRIINQTPFSGDPPSDNKDPDGVLSVSLHEIQLS